MARSHTLVLAGYLALLGSRAPAADHEITVKVDPRVELMSIIFRLAGHPEYNQPNSKSPYADDVEEHFGDFRKHAVIQTARELRATRGVSYDAVMGMAIHVQDVHELKPCIPFKRKPERLDARWKPAEADEFLQHARQFVEDTRFEEFFAQHKDLYEQTAARMSKKLRERAYLDWFNTFFGARPGAEFVVIPGMLNGGCSYGVGIRYPDGNEKICPVIGVWQFDAKGIPIFDQGFVGTVVHELCHSYTNALVDKYADQLEPAGKKLYRRCQAIMQRQAYGNWKTLMYESMVRACVVRHFLAHDGKEAAKQEVRRQHDKGFKWTRKLANVLGQYERNRDDYSTLDAFMPQIVAFFNDYAAALKEETADAPRVSSITPANGATDVDPNLKAITIVFDRPMVDKNWSVVGGGPHFPEVAGDISYDKACKVLTIPVRLKPDWSYAFLLNSDRFQSFRSREGIPLEPVHVTFQTRKRP